MMRASRFRGLPAQLILALGLALAAVAVTALVLPWAGHDLRDTTILAQAPVLRLILLLASYALVGLAAYRRSGDAAASAVAVLLGAALGWGGWEWSTLSPGWLLFAVLVLLQTWPGERPALISFALIIPWALLHPGAAWGALLLIASAMGGTLVESRRRILLLGGGLGACAILMLRGIDLRATVLPLVRPWVWADGQARNTLADPVGLAIFALILALLGLRLLRPGHNHTGLAALALFGFLAWHMRRNGLWLGLAATPVLTVALSGTWKAARLPGAYARATILAAATAVGGGLLVAASVIGPPAVAGISLPQAALQSVPTTGLIMYRPEFEPALLRVHSRSMLALARPADDSIYEIWERIAADCAPADELKNLQAEAIVLDPRQDATVIATLQTEGWQVAWSGAPATVLLRPEILQ